MTTRIALACLGMLLAGCGSGGEVGFIDHTDQVGSVSDVYFAGVPVEGDFVVTMAPGERREFELIARHPTIPAMAPDEEEAERIVSADYRNPAPAIVFPWMLTPEGEDANEKPNPHYAAAFYLPSEGDAEVPAADRLMVRGVVLAPQKPGDYKVRVFYLPTPKHLGGNEAAAPKVNEDGTLRADWLAEIPIRVAS